VVHYNGVVVCVWVALASLQGPQNKVFVKWSDVKVSTAKERFAYHLSSRISGNCHFRTANRESTVHGIALLFPLLTRRMCSLFMAVLVLLISDLTYARPITLPIQPTTQVVFAYQIPSRVRRNSAFSGPLSSNRTACSKHEDGKF